MKSLPLVITVLLCSLLTPVIGAAAVIGEWKFDGNGNNEVVGSPSATLVGAAVWQASGGVSGGYLYVPSASDSVSIPYNAIFDLATEFTIEFWFRQRQDRDFQQNLVYKGAGPNNYNFYVFRRLWDAFNNGAIIAGYSSSGPIWNQTSNPNDLEHNVWHYVAYTKNATIQAYYLDGELIHSSEVTADALTPALPIVVGDTAVDTDFDELRISSHSKTEEEIVTYYNSLVVTANAGNDVTICNGESVQLDATGSTGPAPLTYSWSPGGSTSPTPTVSPSLTTAYTVTVSGSNGSSDTDQVTVTVCLKPTADAGPDKGVCAGSAMGLGGAPTASGGKGPYTYAWTPSTYLGDPTAANPTASPPADASDQQIPYTVLVTDTGCNSCTDSDEMVLTVNHLPDCALTVDGGSGGSTDSVEPGSVHTARVTEVGAASYVWDVTNATIESGQGTQEITWRAPLEPAEIQIKVTVTTSAGCECVFDPSLGVPPGSHDGILRVTRYIPTIAGWGMIGLVMLLAGAGAWHVSVKRRKRN